MIGLELWYGAVAGSLVSVVLIQLFDGGRLMTTVSAVWGLICLVLLGLFAIGV